MSQTGTICLGLLASITSLLVGPASAQPLQQKPNILVIMADDIGSWNISAYNRGMMGYRTPSIDRLAHEGAVFTDYYGQQSCTAGRAAFITGQSPLRTGLLKVGLPGAKEGLSDSDGAYGLVDQYPARAWVLSADNPQCVVGYRCKDGPDNSDF